MSPRAVKINYGEKLFAFLLETASLLNLNENATHCCWLSHLPYSLKKTIIFGRHLSWWLELHFFRIKQLSKLRCKMQQTKNLIQFPDPSSMNIWNNGYCGQAETEPCEFLNVWIFSIYAHTVYIISLTFVWIYYIS